jgi:hypothetical protein
MFISTELLPPRIKKIDKEMFFCVVLVDIERSDWGLRIGTVFATYPPPFQM